MFLQHYESASQHQLPILGTVALQTKSEHSHFENQLVGFNVTEIPDLNLLGRDSIKHLNISVDTRMKHSNAYSNGSLQCHTVSEELQPHPCRQICCIDFCNSGFPNLFHALFPVKFSPVPVSTSKFMLCRPFNWIGN